MYMHYNKQADAWLLIYLTLPFLRYSLGTTLIITLLPMAHQQVKLMGHLPSMGRVPLALLSKSPCTMK
jgi:hypothetical protein